jgi:hypothetical protein
MSPKVKAIEATDAVAWARVYPAVQRARSKSLRRGAWYPVVNDELPDRVSIRLGPWAVDVPRRLVEVRRDRPDYFSVVNRVDYQDHPRRKSEYNLGKHYAVCPVCAHRFAILGDPDTLECPQCTHRAQIAWWED